MRKMERQIIAICRAEGFALPRISRRGGHLRLCFEAGFVAVASTPSDRRNMLNIRAEVRRLHTR